jgi:hypothetical protein
MNSLVESNRKFFNPIFKFFNTKALIFVLFKNTKFGYRAFESRHSIMVSATTRELLIEEIKKQVNKHFGGIFYGKIVLREFIDEEIKV